MPVLPLMRQPENDEADFFTMGLIIILDISILQWGPSGLPMARNCDAGLECITWEW